jgi:amino acid adenylation domain-containing protein/thioester reductase-like protein
MADPAQRSGSPDPASRRSGLSATKRDLLARLVRGDAVPRPAESAIPRRPAAAVAPLSFAQQRIWFIDQLEPGSPAYNISAALHLAGRLDRPALAASFDEILRRHEVLRTTFAATGGRPIQVIHPRLSAALPVVDLAALPAGRGSSSMRELAREEGRRPFDLARGPLLRLGLLALAAGEHVLLLTVNHSVADGWSIGLLVHELAAFYRGFLDGKPAPLPELPIQYADFAVWQRRHLSDERLASQIAYWRRQLAGAPSLLELPADRPRPPLQSFRGASLPFRIAPSRLVGLRDVCRTGSATPYMGLLAGFSALLHRYSDQTDIVVGSPVASRQRLELEKLVGFFANTLVLRLGLSGDPPFRELLARVQAVARGAYAHQDLPLERLVEELQPERHLSYTPLFQVMLVLQNAPMPRLELAGLTLSILDLDPGTAKFDLLLNVTEDADGGLSGALEYSTDLFDRDRMTRLLDHLAVLLEGAGNDPATSLSHLPLLTAAERWHILAEWNDTASPAPVPATLQEPVERWAERHPEALAAVFAGAGDEGMEGGPGEILLTYGDLNRRANRLAHFLLALGVLPDSRVAICLPRSLDLLVAVLAVLKAGAAYVPIDPEYPAERVAFMLEDSESRVLLTRAAFSARLPEGKARPVLLDAEQAAIAARSAANPALPVGASHLAYLIYTSGSTGRPKGVAMPHGVLANLFTWQLAASAAGRGSRTLQFASLSFDVSCQEIFATWWSGGTLVLIPQEVRRDPMALCRVLREAAVERLFLPYVALQQLAEAVAQGAEPPARLAEILTAGDQLQVTRQIVDWLSDHGAARLENQYGPSEGHVVTAGRLAGPAAGWPRLPSIGRPVANVMMYLLDRHFAPAPIGIPGNLYIGGRQVVRGYHNRPELTAQKFVPDLWSGEPGARIYATGDRARWLADGNIQFLGRSDEQVKIRGFRVEPGEVEAQIARHPAVREAAVVVHGEGRERSLVGYFVSEGPLAPAELRELLLRRLPDYMVPAVLVQLDALPLTPSGKVHRAALPPPGAAAESLAYTAPRNAIEEIVAGIWIEILGLPRVDIHTDFFALGGHSLTATRLVYAVQSALGVELPLRALFANPTVAGLVAAIAELEQGQAATALPVMTTAALAAEASLDPAISAAVEPGHAAAAGAARSPAWRPAAPPRSPAGPGVLLTGATGFLGAFLLDEILRRLPEARVHCLVRAASGREAEERLRARLRSFGLWDEALAERIVALPGDLARPLLGLAPAQWNRLGGEIDVIYHNGAFVNMFYAYSTLKPANVLGTEEVLRLAALAPVKPVHYVSTTGVFFAAGGPGPELVDEETELEAVPGLVGGYAQSKWVAEKLVRLAGTRGLPVTIYRPGRIGGHSRTGLGNPDDLLFRILQGSLQLGCAPEMALEVELSPVDYVSRALVHLSLQPGSRGKTFHLINPQPVPWDQLLAWLGELGAPLARLPWADWLEELHRAAKHSTNNALYPMLPVLRAGPSAAGEGSEAPDRETRFDCRRTLLAVSGSGVTCPPLDATLLRLYLTRLATPGDRAPVTTQSMPH